MFKKPGKLVVVAWGDAWSRGSWGPDEGHGPVKVNSCGWVIKHDKEGIFLSGMKADDGAQGRHAFIPAGMIKKIKVVK